jgi:hypothetical protein
VARSLYNRADGVVDGRLGPMSRRYLECTSCGARLKQVMRLGYVDATEHGLDRGFWERLDADH